MTDTVYMEWLLSSISYLVCPQGVEGGGGWQGMMMIMMTIMMMTDNNDILGTSFHHL